MPIYEYECTHCGHTLEKIQKVSDSPLTLCPACSTDNLRKKVSAAAFRLKGGGWYVTDFKDSNKPKVESKDDTKKADNADKPAEKSDAKAAGNESKPETKKSEPAASD